MRKRITGQATWDPSPAGPDWLDLERLAEAEVTSEAPGHPIESALTAGHGAGWRAAGPGEQVVRLLFAEPVRLRRIRVAFREQEAARTQEFVLRWSADGGSFRDVVRQQYTFGPPGTTEEVEEYRVLIDGATALELRIVPDVGGGTARASLAVFRLG